MKEYQIVQANGITLLEERVKAKIKTGWKCQGGLSTSILSDGITFYQAMVEVKK